MPVIALDHLLDSTGNLSKALDIACTLMVQGNVYSDPTKARDDMLTEAASE